MFVTYNNQLESLRQFPHDYLPVSSLRESGRARGSEFLVRRSHHVSYYGDISDYAMVQLK